MTYQDVCEFPAFRRKIWAADTFVVVTDDGYYLSTPEKLSDWKPSAREKRARDYEVFF